MSTTLPVRAAEVIDTQADHIARCGGDPDVYRAIALGKQLEGRRKVKGLGARRVRVHLPAPGRDDD